MATAANHMKDSVAWTSAAVPGRVRSIWVQDVFVSVDPTGLDARLDMGGRESRQEKGMF